ncbi:MAG: dihydroorotate dehydrogenase [Acidimicrobiia bacterium]|nr:dihydroorotate dehydrogenase [Acidimicrobiia bacterium]
MSPERDVDTQVAVGDVVLPTPVMAAAGCFGTGAELLGTVDVARLGAVVTKSMSEQAWPGNPPPRLVPGDGGTMLNAVGLQNPGVTPWVERELPRLLEAGARVVASIWGRSPEDFAGAAAALAATAVPGRDGTGLVAVEVNLSCPNVEAAGDVFAHDAGRVDDVVRRVVAELGDLPAWAKLSPNVPSALPAARAARDAGAAAIVLVNTVIGMSIDIEAARPALANGTGGLSGPPIRPVAVRHIYDVHAAMPDVPVVGVGGVTCAAHAVELMMAGASAVQMGTAHLADPHAGIRCARDLRKWAARHGVTRLADLTGAAHGRAGRQERT